MLCCTQSYLKDQRWCDGTHNSKGDHPMLIKIPKVVFPKLLVDWFNNSLTRCTVAKRHPYIEIVSFDATITKQYKESITVRNCT